MATNSLVLHTFHASQPGRAIELFLESAHIKYEKKSVNFLIGEHQTEEYRTINPFAQVPAIDHAGFILNESVAILRYLCNAYKVGHPWYPDCTQQRAKIDAYLAWQHNDLRINGTITFLHNVMKDKRFTPERVREAREGLDKALTTIETIFLKETPFVYSEHITIADLLCVSEVIQPVAGGYDLKELHPKCYDYVLRVRKAIGEELFDRITKPLFVTVKAKYFLE